MIETKITLTPDPSTLDGDSAKQLATISKLGFKILGFTYKVIVFLFSIKHGYSDHKIVLDARITLEPKPKK